jgi:hypothetical protein
MGNMIRARELWLADEMISTKKLYPTHEGNDFAPHTIYPLARLPRNQNGDVLTAITTDEKNPALVFPFPGSTRWHYGGFPVTQYWKKPRGTFRDDLHMAVNARFRYWKNHRPIPGGVSFENFELREKFYDGQQFIFGITGKTPKELGIGVTSFQKFESRFLLRSTLAGRGRSKMKQHISHQYLEL